MKIDRNGEIDPRFMVDDEPEAEICQCCDEQEAFEKHETRNGRIWMCAFCLDWHMKNDTKFLILT